MLKIGMDLGTTRTKIAMLTESGEPQLLTNRQGETFTFSEVYFPGDGTHYIGTEAKNAALAEPKRSVANWKAHIGTDKVLYIDDDGTEYMAVNIASIIIKTIINDIEAKMQDTVGELVITVPANYTNAQKQDTKKAAEMAGVKVLLMPHEPTAGALGNHVNKLKNGTVIVCDIGGGTTDISVIKAKGNVCEVTATGGIPKLGGRDFNRRIKDHVIDAFETKFSYRPNEDEHAIFHQDLETRIEQAKINLSVQKQANIVVSNNGDMLNLTITRQKFEELVADLINQIVDITEKTLKEGSLGWADIDAIYPIGGASMMPKIVESLEKASGKSVVSNCEAHCAVALGAAVAVRLEYERLGKQVQVGSVTLPPINYYMRDILSRSIGVSALDKSDQEVCCEILGKETPIPSLQTRKFMLSELGQTNVRIHILQGVEGQKAKDCESLGHFDLKELPSSSDHGSRIEVTFDLDANGLLTASARDMVSNKKEELKLDYNNN